MSIRDYVKQNDYKSGGNALVVTGIVRNLPPLNLTFDYVNLKLANEVHMHGALPLEALRISGSPVICGRRRGQVLN